MTDIKLDYIGSERALLIAKENPDCNIAELQEVACSHSGHSLLFAMDIPDANISYCQKRVGTYYDGTAWSFATRIPEANIEYLYKRMWHSERKVVRDFIINEL